MCTYAFTDKRVQKQSSHFMHRWDESDGLKSQAHGRVYRVYIIIIVIFNSTALKTVYVSARRSIFYSHEHVAVCI